MKKKFLLALAALALAATAVATAQTVVNLKNQAPDGVVVAMLLTDGRVLAQGGNSSDWWTLTPDINGSYVNGTWKQVASLPAGYSPLYMAEAVMIDGRVVIEGGEYNFFTFAFTNMGAGYDPIANTWHHDHSPGRMGLHRRFAIRRAAQRAVPCRRKDDHELAELDPHTSTGRSWPSPAKRLERRRGLDAVAQWNRSDSRCEKQPELGTLRCRHSDLDSGRQHGQEPDGSVRSRLHHRHQGYWGTYFPPGEIGPAILRPTERSSRPAPCTLATRRVTPQSSHQARVPTFRVRGQPARTSPTAMTQAITSLLCSPAVTFWWKEVPAPCMSSTELR